MGKEVKELVEKIMTEQEIGIALTTVGEFQQVLNSMSNRIDIFKDIAPKEQTEIFSNLKNTFKTSMEGLDKNLKLKNLPVENDEFENCIDELKKLTTCLKKSFDEVIPTLDEIKKRNSLASIPTYSKLLNAKATNALATIPTSSRAIKAQFTYHPEIESNSLFTEDDVKVTIKDFNNATQLGNSILFFYYLLCSFTQNISYKTTHFSNNDLEIYFDVERYLTARKKEITPDNKKNIIREVKKMYETLKRVSVDFEEYDYNTKEKKRYSLEIFAGKGTTESLIKRSKNYFFIINPLLANYLLERNYITYFPSTAFSIDIMRHPNALSLTNKLSVLYSENFWKTNKGLISLNNLLASVSDIPNFESVSKSNRHYFDRIIEPLENELDYLQEIKILSKWEWTNKKREPLSNEQLTSYDYKALSNCYLSYELADYPEQEQQNFKKRKEEKKKTVTPKKKKI